MNKYANVSSFLFGTTLIYLIIEALHMVSFLMHFMIRAKRGFIYHLSKVYIYMNLPYFMMLIYLIFLRYMFVVRVCMCDFKDDYITIR